MNSHLLDLRPVDTQHAISALRKYLEVMEAQMGEVQRCERVVLEGERPKGADEEEDRIFRDREDALEQLFEQDLIPAMRYSFVVLMHTVFETRLRAFCSNMQTERSIPITLLDVHGSPIERACTYLSKLAALPVANFPEWQHLRTFQKVRNCIVHDYGYVTESGNRKEKKIRALVRQNIGIAIDDYGRLALTKAFCEQYLTHVDTFFGNLFRASGWVT